MLFHCFECFESFERVVGLLELNSGNSLEFHCSNLVSYSNKQTNSPSFPHSELNIPSMHAYVYYKITKGMTEVCTFLSSKKEIKVTFCLTDMRDSYTYKG